MSSSAPNSPIVEVVCAGTPREMGLAQGRGLRDKIHGARVALAELAAFRVQQPWWLPYPLYRWLAERKAARFLAEPLARDYPDIQERLQGIAAGAGVSLQGIMLLNALEPVLSSVGGASLVKA